MPMKPLTRASILIASLLATVAAVRPAAAQPPGATTPAGSIQPPAGAPADKRERIKQRIRTLRAWTLTEELQLDEATAARLFPILSRYDEEFVRLLREAAELRRQGDDAAARNDDPAVDRAVDALVANQRARWSLEEARFRDVRKVLTPRQAARLLVVLPAIDRRLQGQLQRAIGGDRGRRRQPGPPD